MKRDTLLMLTTSFPDAADGSEAAGAFVADLAEEIARTLPVRVVAPGRQAGQVSDQAGVQVRRFASPGRPLSLLSPLRPADWPAIARTLASLREQALLAAADGRVAHTLALWALPSGWAARELQRRHGIPYSVWTLGSDIWTLGRIPVVRGLLRDVLAAAGHRYSDGLRLAEDTRRIAGREVEFLPSTRRIDSVRPVPPRANPPYRLLFLGRWHPNKGIDLLLEALAALGDDDWRRIERVRICGGGPLDATVRAMVARLAEAGRPVTVHGYLDKPAAEAAIAEADWLLVPSRIESIPVVVSDAAKLGCPVLASPVGDLPELIAGPPAAGLVAASVSSEAFAALVSRALRLSPDDFAIGVAALAERFDLAGIAARLVARTGAQA